MQIKKVGVIGCGLMGAGIAQTFAQSGYETLVSEVNEDLLNKGLGIINTNLAKSVQKGRITKEDEESILSRLKGTTKLSDFNDCDLVIEAIIEKMELKRQIFSELDKICPEHTILATNTSCLSIIEMAAATQRASQVMGIHFFNPVPIMKLVELVKTIATSEDTMNTAIEFSKSLRKEVVIAKDTPGFVVNLLLIPFLLDAIRAFDCGLASKEDIDAGIKLGLNHPMGPLTLLDFVGLDTTYYIACAMYEEFKDAKYAPPPLLKKMVTAGWMGRKAGKGFYDYQ